MAKNAPSTSIDGGTAHEGARPRKALLEIFRAGRHVGMSGQEYVFSEADIKASVDAYDPAVQEAPIVIGHPKTDKPARGWIASLRKVGSSIEAEPHQVSPEFAESVRRGEYKKISAAFFSPQHPANPVPGVYYLKHVGFLGAATPAVKGMRNPEFADEDPDVVTFEFSEGSDRIIADVFRRFREWLIEKHSVDDADRIVPNWTIEDLQAEAQREAEERDRPIDAGPISTMGGQIGFSEHQPGDDSMSKENELAEREAKLAAERAKLDAEQAAFADKQAAAEKEAEKVAAFAEQQRTLAAQEADIATRETALREKEEAARLAGIEEFADGLCRKEGRLLLKDKPAVVAFLAALPAQGTEIEFADGDETVKQSPADWFRGFLSRMPVVVHFAEHAPTEGGGGSNASGLTDRQVAERARKYHADAKERGETISFSDAVDAVRAGKDQ